MLTDGPRKTPRSQPIAAKLLRRPLQWRSRVRPFEITCATHASISLRCSLAGGFARSLCDGLVVALFVLAALVVGPKGATATDAEAIECLALTIYFEARGEPDVGKLAVAHVVVNRTLDTRFPRQICDVTRQRSSLPDGGCQFSWVCDGLSDRPTDGAAWRRSKALARQVYYGLSQDSTGGALWYHADYVDPAWSHDLGAPYRIGRHVFYRGFSTPIAEDTKLDRDSRASPRMAANNKHYWKLGQHPNEDLFSTIKQAVALSAPWASILSVSMHFYSKDKARRFVRINKTVYAEGDWLTPDIRLEAITPQGVVVRDGNGQYGLLLQ